MPIDNLADVNLWKKFSQEARRSCGIDRVGRLGAAITHPPIPAAMAIRNAISGEGGRERRAISEFERARPASNLVRTAKICNKEEARRQPPVMCDRALDK